MTDRRARRRGPLTGRLRVPGDKSISHRALLLAALAEGTAQLRGLSAGLMSDAPSGRWGRAAPVSRSKRSPGRGGAITVAGGRGRLHEPTAVIDVGNSGTGIRLLAGWSAGFPWLTVLQGDGSSRSARWGG